MSYTVWIHQTDSEGWQPSDDLSTLAEVLEYLVKNTYGHRYMVMREVKVSLIETPSAAKVPFGVGPVMPGMAGMAGRLLGVPND